MTVTDISELVDQTRRNDADNFVASLIAKDELDPLVPISFVAHRENYVPFVAACRGRLSRHGNELPAVLFAAESMPLRLGRCFGIIPIKGSNHVTLGETFSAIAHARGDAGECVRCLLGAIDWKDASHVGRAAILLRVAVQHRRGFPISRLTMADIQRGAAE